MKHKSIIIAICSVVILTSCDGPLTKSKIDTIETAVFDVHNKMVAAAENRDANAMFEYILDSDQTVIQTGDTVQTREQALESVRNSFRNFQKVQYEFTQRQISVLSPTTVEMTAAGRSIDTTHDGRVLIFPFSQTIRFVLTDNGWKLHDAHYIPENSQSD